MPPCGRTDRDRDHGGGGDPGGGGATLRAVAERIRSKSYLIVIDDVIQDRWQVIKCAFPDDNKGSRLQGIHKLFQLKYLGLGGGVPALPKQIEELENLETLDIRPTRVRQLAVDDGDFQRLAHLLVTGVELPSGVGKMKNLQELSMVDVSKSNAAAVEELGELLKLRILGLKWSLKKGDKDCAACEQNLVDALNKLTLQHLCLDADKDCSLDFLVESWCPSSKLREFKLACSHYYFPHVPKTMARAELPRLTYLEIGMATVSNEDLDILGGLRALIILKLRSGDSDKQRVVIGGQAGFPLLELFWLERRDGAITVTGLSFKERAMPKLRKLRLRCKYNALGLGAALAGPELGLGNLGSLKQVHVKMDLEGVADPEVEAAVAAVTKAANVPSKCRLEISRLPLSF
ncbi:disease resistance protein RGA2-like [Setaria italica]|uniref:disease resistance protein RGA2-like n=1 Tax=Setaria italica TaxID=4555 RepID=UPI000BE58E1B|nr:disease resistance protein RGA2-like [Setaria italica]